MIRGRSLVVFLSASLLLTVLGCSQDSANAPIPTKTGSGSSGSSTSGSGAAAPTDPDFVDPGLGDPPTPNALAPSEIAMTSLPFDVIQTMRLETYEKSGQVVHPDKALVPPGWSVGPHDLVITPYPNGDARFENPSFFTSDNGKDWTIPGGVTNPVATPIAGYLSDPDQLYNPGRSELWMYYRQVATYNEIYLMRSSNGTTWSTPIRVLRAPNHYIISPSVVRVGAGNWKMWSVNSGTDGCTGEKTTVELRQSSDGLRWSSPQPVDLTLPNGMSPWHIDVEWIPARSEFWAIFNAKTAGSCTTPALYMATSADGVHWVTFPSPVLARGAIPEFQDVVYRSTFAYDAETDEVTFWYSGARYDRDSGAYVWGAAVQKRRRSTLFSDIAGLAPSYSRFVAEHPSKSPALTTATAP